MTEVLIFGGLAVFVGAVVQGSVGFGLGLIAAPVITLMEPGLMPGAVQVANLTLPLLTLAREWRLIDWRGLGFAVLGRVPGGLVGAYIVVYVSVQTLGVLVGAMVLIAVVVTAKAPSLPRNGYTVTGAGFVSGITGTATGIGGPPIALVYQDAKGSQIRGTLALYFFLSAAQSLVLLAVVGHLPGRALAIGALLLIPMIAGFLASGPVRRYVDGGKMRAAILVVAALSAIVLIGQSLLR